MAAYLAYRAGIGRSLSTLAMDRKAISHHHGKRGYPTPMASEGVEAARRRGDVDIALASVMRDALLRRGQSAGRGAVAKFYSNGRS